MKVQPDRLDPVEPGREPVDLQRPVVGDAELVVAPAGADAVVRPGGDVRVDPQGHRCLAAHAGRDLADAPQLRDRLDVELEDALSERQPDLVVGLGHAGQHDPLRRHAGGQRPADLAARDRVGPGPGVRHEAQDCEVAVRLERVADERVAVREGALQGREAAADRVRGVDVAGCADLGREGVERHRLGVQHAPAIGEGVRGVVRGCRRHGNGRARAGAANVWKAAVMISKGPRCAGPAGTGGLALSLWRPAYFTRP